MLTNVLFAGWIIKFGEKHRGTFTQIVSDDLFEQVQQVLKYKGRKHSAYKTDNPDFPLRKFIINENNKKLTGSWSQGRRKKYPFYRFGGNASNHNRDNFEKAFMEFVDKYRFDTTKLSKLRIYVRKHLTEESLSQQKQTEKLKKYVNDLTDKQSGIIKKNLDGIIPDNVLKQQLELIDQDLIKANGLLSVIPYADTNYEEAIEFIAQYLKRPSLVWRKSPIEYQIKLQWFQFPLGLTFQNNSFGTIETCLFFKDKFPFLEGKSSTVDLRFQKSNTLEPTTKDTITQTESFCQHLARDIIMLYEILKETPGYH